MTGLVNDPKRQAQDAVRGYVYQVLRSIIVWLDLRDGEELFLEGAEDLDRIDGSVAQTEQVKDTVGSGNITLRTESVVEAIDNFWTHASRNPEIAITFRYVTTSGIGAEQGKPFGDARAGLELWNSAAIAGSGASAEQDAQSIGSFLLAEGKVGKAITGFLKTASGAEILAKLIKPMTWAAGQRDGAALVRQIKDRLVVHGHAGGIAPADAEQAFDALYTAAFDAATKKDDVPLTRAGFLRIFAGATAIQIPKNELLALVQATMEPSQAMMVQPVMEGLEGAPPLPARYFRRVEQEQQLETALSGGAVVLCGATGSGKTLTAASTLAGQDPVWITLRDLNPGETKSRLVFANQQLRGQAKARTLVLDDIDALADLRTVESALAALWNTQKALGGRLIVTSDRSLPARLAQAIELNTARELQVQPFSASEIEVFLLQAGCPGELAAGWSKVLELSTLGHPQLVSVRIATLIEEQFRNPAAEDLFKTPPEEDQIRFEARRLISGLPEEARELLYRASLLTGRMNRQRLMAIARLADPIAEPGTAVDVISGPWLEITDDRQFRVSPLARGAADQARGADWVKAMHGHLAWVYLQDRKITPWDISSILMHCCVAGTAGPLVYLIGGALSASEEVWGLIGEACSIYLAIGPEAGSLPFKRSADVFVFRIFQYRIAAATDPEAATRIGEKLDIEFKAGADDDVAQFFRFLYLSQLLSVLAVKYSMAVVVARACEFVELAKAIEIGLPERLARAGLPAEDVPSGNYAQFAGLRLVSHVKTIEDLADLTTALSACSTEQARAILDSIGEPNDMVSVLADTAWIDNFQTKRVPWPNFREKLRAMYDFAVSIEAFSVARGVAPTLLRVIDEDVEDPQAALAEANELKDVVGDDPIFQCAFAKVIDHAGDRSRALEIWRQALPRWPDAENDIGCSFAYRSAAMAAGGVGAWREAAQFFSKARTLVQGGEKPTFTIGLTMDAAFCRFMAGDQDSAVREFGAVLASLESLQSELENEPLLSLQRRVGGVLSAISGRVDGVRTDDELAILIGVCSNLDPLEIEAKVPPPLDALRMDLIRVQVEYGASIDEAVDAAVKLRGSPIASFQAVSAGMLFGLAQRTRDFSQIVSDGLRQLDALAMMHEQRASGEWNVMRRHDGAERTWTAGADEFVVGNVVLAVVDLAAADELDRLPLDQWRVDAATHPQATRILALIDHLQGLFVTAEIEAWATVVQCITPDWSHQTTSAIAATLLEAHAPDILLQCHALCVLNLSQPHLRAAAGAGLERLVTDQWSNLVQLAGLLPGGRAALRPLRGAVADAAQGWTKTKVVLEAALLFVPVDADDKARLVIEGMET